MNGESGGCVHSLDSKDYQYIEESRKGVTFTLVSAPDHLVALHICQSQPPPVTNQAVLVLPVYPGDFYFNSIKLDETQVGLSTFNSGAPFSICCPPRALWLIISFTSSSRHLDLMSATGMPVTLIGGRLKTIRDEVCRYLENGQAEGTPVLDQVHWLLDDIESTPPPLRPQKSTGRSRLPRLHLVPSIFKAIDHQRSSAPFVNQVAERLGITAHTVINMFKEVTGMSPKQYWLNRKLYLYRDALLGGEYVSVSDAAYSLDMNDLGRMSARYRKRFGEFPSETLKCIT